MLLEYLKKEEAPIPPSGFGLSFLDEDDNKFKVKLRSGEIINFSAGGLNFSDGICYYGFINDGQTHSYTQFNESMINLPTVKQDSLLNLRDEDVEISAPAGSLVFALVEKKSNYIAKRSNGISGRCNFDENNGSENSGVNGLEIMISGKEFLLFCEFNLINVDTVIQFYED
jgi:hypothetical protein